MFHDRLMKDFGSSFFVGAAVNMEGGRHGKRIVRSVGPSIVTRWAAINRAGLLVDVWGPFYKLICFAS